MKKLITILSLINLTTTAFAGEVDHAQYCQNAKTQHAEMIQSMNEAYQSGEILDSTLESAIVDLNAKAEIYNQVCPGYNFPMLN